MKIYWLAIALAVAVASVAHAQSTQTEPVAAEIVPGEGEITDAANNQWTIQKDGHIMENGRAVKGGGGTAALTIEGGKVWGLDAGTPGVPCPHCWFTLSTADQSANQIWNASTAPPDGFPAGATPSDQTNTPAPIASDNNSPAAPPPPPPPGPIALGQTTQYACTTSAPNSAPSQGGFATINGTLYQPDGKPWVARGVDIHDWDLNTLASTLPQLFPGLNMVRVAIESLNDNPVTYASAVRTLTAQGIVVEFSDYTNTTGNNVGGDEGSVYTGSQLASENAMYAAFAGYYKSNPYVWTGTNNEPAHTGGSLSQWQLATYTAVRGAGNTAPILIDPGGSRPAGFGGTPEGSALDPSVYAQMENVAADPHVYPYQSGNSADQATANALVAATVAGMKKLRTLDGPMPVIVGEYGPQFGMNNGADRVTINAVQNDQNWGGSGSTAWAVNTSGQLNLLTNGASGPVTPWGQSVADFTRGSGNTGCNISPDPALVPTKATVANPEMLIPTNSIAGITAPQGIN